MKYVPNHPTRRGAIIPMVAVCLVALMGMVALAIDIGMVAIAKNQAQNAADTAACATVRTLNGTSTYNLNAAPSAGMTAAKNNAILGSAIACSSSTTTLSATDVYTSGPVTLSLGGYYYTYNDSSPATEAFNLVVPGKAATQPYTAVTATIQTTSPTFFGSVLGAGPFNVIASATAAYRPRDVSLIVDLSGSMRFNSCIGAYLSGGNLAPYEGPRNTSMNADPNYPQFGHYSAVGTAALQGNASYPTLDVIATPGNVVYDPLSGPLMVNDYMSSGSSPAFTAASTTLATTPGGDNYLKASGNYVQTVGGLLGFTAPSNAAQTTTALNWCQNGYQGQTGSAFNGYTQGPSYWGKTFFIWPPDPRGSDLDPTNSANHANNGALDWRQRFFFKVNSGTGQLYWLDQNPVLFNPSGATCTTLATTTPIINLFGSGGTVTSVTENGAAVKYYCLPNYAAIFQWLKNQNPTGIFPASMLSGRIQFYSKIPDPTGDNGFNNRFWTQNPMTDLSERFWKDYVDFMLGQVQTGAGAYANQDSFGVPYTAYIGTGDMFAWGTVALTQKTDTPVFTTGTVSAAVKAGTSAVTIKGLGTALTAGSTYYVRFGYTPSSGSTYYGSWFYQFTAPAAVSGAYTFNLNIPIPSGQPGVAANAPVRIYSAIPTYMSYTDNPFRPRHQLWFGPQTWIDWLGNYSLFVNQTPLGSSMRWAGNTHENQSWACKVGLSNAITDMQNNNPADYIGLVFFNSPATSTSGGGVYNGALVPLGQNYTQMQNSLWFPPTTVTGKATSITPYDPDFVNVPRANFYTAPQMPFMITYNMFSSSVASLRNYAQPSSTYRGFAGGLGRKGAQRLVIFETDGDPNTSATAALSGSGSDSYYQIRVYDPTNVGNSSNVEFPSSSYGAFTASTAYAVIQQICAQTTASPPGFSTTRKPAQVYALGYGSLFNPSNSTLPGQAGALTFLQSVQYYGGTSPNTSGSSFPTSQLIYGSATNMATQMQTAINNILQQNISVSLLR